MGGFRGGRLGLCALLVLGCLAGAGIALTDQPAWSGDVLNMLEKIATKHNDRIVDEDRTLLERRLVSNARVNLFVRGPGPSTAAFTFRTDDRSRVRALRRGSDENPTLRVTAKRETIEQIYRSDDHRAAIATAVRNGRIQVERVYWGIPIGREEVVVGAGGVVLIIVVAKYGLEALFSWVIHGLQTVFGALTTVVNGIWEILEGLGVIITLLKELGMLKRVKESLAGAWERLRRAVGKVLNLGRTPPSGDDVDEQDRDR